MLFSSRVRVEKRFSVWSGSGYAHVFVLLSVVIVAPPCTQCRRISRQLEKQNGFIISATNSGPHRRSLQRSIVSPLFAVLSNWLMQHWIDCMQFFFYIIVAVLVKYHDVNNRNCHFVKDC